MASKLSQSAIVAQTHKSRISFSFTQWPWLQSRLRDDRNDVQKLDRLMMKSRDWSKALANRKADYLAAGAEREPFDELARQRPDWLSGVDRDFIDESNRAYETERDKEQRAFRVARHNESVALAALANIEAVKHPVNAAKLALAAWPRDSNDTATPKLAALDALGQVVPSLRERCVLTGHEKAVNSAAFSPDGTRIVTASSDNTARLWDAATGRAIATLKGHADRVLSAAFSPDGTRVITASGDKTARLWDAASGREVAALKGHEDEVWSAAFSPDGTRIVTASWDNTARLWDAASGRTRRAQGACGRGQFRRLQPGRDARRHGVYRQDRAHLGRQRDPQGPYSAGHLRASQAPRGPCQPRRRDRLSAHLRSSDLHHRPAAAGPHGRVGGAGERRKMSIRSQWNGRGNLEEGEAHDAEPGMEGLSGLGEAGPGLAIRDGAVEPGGARLCRRGGGLRRRHDAVSR
jgi:hypothetical protein